MALSVNVSILFEPDAMIILEYIIVKYFLRKSKGFLVKSEKRKTHSYNR